MFFALVLGRNRTLVELDLTDNGMGSVSTRCVRNFSICADTTKSLSCLSPMMQSPPTERDRTALWKIALGLRGNDVLSKLKLDLNFIGEYASQLLSDFKEETGSLIPRSIANCMTSVHFAAGRPDIKEMFKANSVPSKKSKKGKKKKGRRKKKK